MTIKQNAKEENVMKIGMRKPSIKKSISARTTGRAKRAVKKAVIPGYGKKGSGWIKNPKKAAYNKVYNKTTFSVTDIAKTASSSRSKKTSDASYNNIVPKDIVICPNCGQPLKKSEVSEYYLCDNCKIRIQPDNVQLSSASKPKKKKQGKAGCFGWFCSIMLILVGISCLGILFSSDSEKETKMSSAAETTVQSETSLQTESAAISEQTSQTEAPTQEPKSSSYVLNLSTMKFHYPSCRDVSKIADENYGTYKGTRDDLINQGYSPCGHCNP